MKQHAFWKSYFKMSVGEIEFQYFKDLVLPQILPTAREIDRFERLHEIYSFDTDDTRPEALQIEFGKRPMLRKDLEGKFVSEKGAQLLYSLGPTGAVAVVLYPATSNLAKPFEDHIFLRIGHYSGYQLQKRFSRDLSDLVAYCHVTSLDGDPTVSERCRVMWLRHMHPMQVKGEFTSARVFRYGGVAFEFTMRTMLLALIKPLVILVVIILLIYLGMPQLASLLKL